MKHQAPVSTEQIMTESKHLKLSFLATLNHYFIVLVLLVLAVIPSYDSILFWIQGGDFKGVVLTKSLALSAIWLFSAIAFIFVQRRQLRFLKYEGEATVNQIEEAFDRTAKLHRWKNKQKLAHLFRAFHDDWFSPMKGEMITVLIVDGEIWVNSVCDLKSWSTVSSLGWNMHNVKLFFHHLNAVKAGKPLNMDEAPAIQKKATRQLARRIFTYPAAIITCIVGVYYFFNGVGRFHTFIAVFLIVLPILYVLVDLKALRGKTKADKP